LSYGFWIPTSCVHVEGVDKIDIADFK
jgi:hypothetical protein